MIISGVAIQLPGSLYKVVVGLVLLFAAFRLMVDPRKTTTTANAPAPPLIAAIAIGAGIGLLAGLTGTGGGIFLSPILLFAGWAGARQSAGMTTPFILINSVAGLAGNYLSLSAVSVEIPIYAAAALAGAVLGTQMAIYWFSPATLQRVLAAGLVVAAGKLILTSFDS